MFSFYLSVHQQDAPEVSIFWDNAKHDANLVNKGLLHHVRHAMDKIVQFGVYHVELHWQTKIGREVRRKEIVGDGHHGWVYTEWG